MSKGMTFWIVPLAMLLACLMFYLQGKDSTTGEVQAMGGGTELDEVTFLQTKLGKDTFSTDASRSTEHRFSSWSHNKAMDLKGSLRDLPPMAALIKCDNGCSPDLACNFSPGDTSFMIMASTFVMIQTPAMGITQAGLIRRKNAMSMLMQTLTGLAVGSVLWMIIGFSMTFGPSHGGVIGNLQYMMMSQVPINGCLPHADSIPGLVFVFFQMMFALMVPVIVTGAWAEKMTYKAFLIFVVLWPIMVYYFLAHWVWNSEGWLFKQGVMDFAGGITIHTPAGTAATVVMRMLKKRSKQLGADVGGGHNLVVAVFGASFIWAGWYSFNGGSALKANAQAAAAVFNTHISSCCAAIVWSMAHHYMRKKGQEGGKLGHEWHATEFCNGALAGLAAITPGSGFVHPWASMVIGSIAGVAAFGADQFRQYLDMDDVCCVIALQGVPGSLGSILVGLFAAEPVGGVNGIFYGGEGSVLGWQICAVLASVGWTAFWTFIIMLIIKKTVGIDVPPKAEVVGLDSWQTGDQAYDMVYDDEDEIRTRLLHGACHGDNDDLQMMRSALCRGINPDWKDYDGRTALHVAASWRNVAAVRLLIKFGANVNVSDRDGRTPLVSALHYGLCARSFGDLRASERIATMLLDDGATLGKDGGVAAAEVMQDILLMCGSGDHFCDLMKVYIRAGALRLVHGGDYDGRGVLHLAMFYGHRLLTQLLLANAHVLSADIFEKKDRWGHTPQYCAEHPSKTVPGDVRAQVLSMLQSHIKGVAIAPPDGTAGEDDTPVPGAAKEPVSCLKWGWEDTHVLLNIGTALPEGAADQSNLQDFIQLVERADSSARILVNKESDDAMLQDMKLNTIHDYDGRTLLHVAVSKQCTGAIKFLLKRYGNAIVHQVDRWGSTPLMEAVLQARTKIEKSEQQKASDVIELLRSVMHSEPRTPENYPFGIGRLAYHACNAAANGEDDKISALAETFDILSVADYDERTPLHLACSNGQVKVVNALLEIAKDAETRKRMLSRKDVNGNTPEDDARNASSTEVITALGMNPSNLVSNPVGHSSKEAPKNGEEGASQSL